MNRRQFGLGLAGLTAALLPSAAWAGVLPLDHPLQASWRLWKDLHLTGEGRVVDGFQGGASHSEGQGYGMTLAVSFGDAPAFAAMHAWAEARLAVRPDGLLAWRWRPDAAVAVEDPNNASDGDLFYAWALVRGAQLFREAAWLDRARAVAEALDAVCVVERPGGRGLLLLPAADGFLTPDGAIVNPSYLMPRALREVAEATGVPRLARCADDGEALLAEFAADGLTPDWAEVTADGWRPAAGMSAASGYEAMRTPLFLLWSGAAAHPAIARAAEAQRRAAADRLAGAPVVFDRVSLVATERSAHAGYAALAALVRCAPSDEIGAPIPPFGGGQPYYPATLHLMAMLAQTERFPRCVPI